MKFEDDLTEFINSLTKVKKPVEKKSGIPSKYIISKDGKITPVKDAFIGIGEVSEDDNLLEPQYWNYETNKTNNIDNSIIKKEE